MIVICFIGIKIANNVHHMSNNHGKLKSYLIQILIKMKYQSQNMYLNDYHAGINESLSAFHCDVQCSNEINLHQVVIGELLMLHQSLNHLWCGQ